MNINLRKAAALQNAIQDAIRGITLNLTVRLNEFQDPEQILNQRSADAMLADARRNDLLVALYSVRAQVAVANARVGITDLLARGAYTDKRIEQLNQFVSADVREDLDVIKGKLEKIRNRKDEGRSLYREDEVNTGVLGKDNIEAIKVIHRDMRKQKQRINDEVLELNVKTEIQLADDIVAILQRENLV